MLEHEYQEYSHTYIFSDDKNQSVQMSEKNLKEMNLTALDVVTTFNDIADWLWWKDVYFYILRRLEEGDLTILYTHQLWTI